MSYKILLIDPDASHVAALERPLSDAGYDVVIAGDRESGLEAVERERPDLALVEAFLPSDEALELCQDLKTGGEGNPIPVVILSDPDSELAPEFADLKGFGCDEYVRLPLADDDLIAMCARLLADAAPGAIAADAGDAEDAEDAPVTEDELDFDLDADDDDLQAAAGGEPGDDAGFDEALDDLGAELEAAAAGATAADADDAEDAEDAEDAAGAERRQDPEGTDESDGGGDSEGAAVLRFQSAEPGRDVPDSLRESLRELQEEESRLDGFLERRSGEGSGRRVRPSVLGMDAIVERLESTEAPEPVLQPLRPIGAGSKEDAADAPAETAEAAPPPGGADRPGDPFAATDEIGAHIDSLFGSDPGTPIAETRPAPSGGAPELIGIDSDLVAWDSAAAPDDGVTAHRATASASASPFAVGPDAAWDDGGSFAPPIDDDVIPGAEPFRPHVENGGPLEELAIDGMDEPAGSTGKAGWIVTAALIVVAGGGTALWLLPDAPPPTAPEPAAEVQPAPAPRPVEPATRPTVFDAAFAEPAAREALEAAAAGAPAVAAATDLAPASPDPTPRSASRSPVERPVERPIEKPTERPTEQPTGRSAQRPVERIAEPSAGSPAGAPAPSQAGPAAPAEKPEARSASTPARPEPRPAEPSAEADAPAAIASAPAGPKPDAEADAVNQYRRELAAQPESDPIRLPSRPVEPLVQYGRGDAAPDTGVDVTDMDFVAPRLDDRPDPGFPAELVAGRSGTNVLLRVRVDERGQVTRIVVEEGRRGDPLTALAIDAVLRSRYSPATAGGRPVRAWITERFSF